jgi:hypothetical protein
MWCFSGRAFELTAGPWEETGCLTVSAGFCRLGAVRRGFGRGRD